MPSRRAVALILLFWFATAGYVAYRDLGPLLFASGPPPMAIDLEDEATQMVTVQWAIYWNDKKSGQLRTHTKYRREDDTFQFSHQYTQLKYTAGPVTVSVPNLHSSARVTRGGDLREQSVTGNLEARVPLLPPLTASAKVLGTVANGQLAATCELESSFGNMKKTLDPVPVPAGQPLNPLQPVNRIAHLRPGQQWVVHENNPLGDAVAALVRESGLKLPETKATGPLVAEVQPKTQDLDWQRERVACWVIEYRRDGEVVARTWVRASDGKVLKQEAFSKGETLSVIRDE